MPEQNPTSIEILRKAIHFQRPPRLPVMMGSLGVSDVGGPWFYASEEFANRPNKPEGMDEWGCIWAKSHLANMGQVVGHPLKDIQGLDAYPMPNYADPTCYRGWEETLTQCEAKSQYVMTGIFMILFERMHVLHGFEDTLADLYADRPAMEALADRIVLVHETLIREIGRRFPGRFHGINMTDDWGTQQSGFVSFDLWMDFFFPRYKRLFDAIHDIGCDVWVHSCGKINDIIEGYIRAGANVVSPLQPRALGIEEIGRRYAGRIAFQSLADIQVTLPLGDPREVEHDVDMLMTHWATPRGGFIFCDYGDDNAIGVSDKTLKPRMYEAFSRWSERLYGQPLPPLHPPPSAAA